MSSIVAGQTCYLVLCFLTSGFVGFVFINCGFVLCNQMVPKLNELNLN